MPAFRPQIAAVLLGGLLAAACGGPAADRGVPGVAGPGASSGSEASSGGSGPGGAPPAGAAPGAPAANAAPGAAGGGGGPAAPGAPIMIPDVVQSQGLDVDVVRLSIETGQNLPGEPGKTYDGVIAQCGGQLCVSVEAKPGTSADGADGFTQCQFVRTEPAPGSQVARGATIWLLTGTQPCAPPDPDAGQASDPGTGPSSDPGAGQASDPGTGPSSDPGADQSSPAEP